MIDQHVKDLKLIKLKRGEIRKRIDEAWVPPLFNRLAKVYITIIIGLVTLLLCVVCSVFELAEYYVFFMVVFIIVFLYQLITEAQTVLLSRDNENRRRSRLTDQDLQDLSMCSKEVRAELMSACIDRHCTLGTLMSISWGLKRKIRKLELDNILSFDKKI